MKQESINIGELSKRFWGKVEKTDTCWKWKGAKQKRGYGRFKINGKIYGSHRVAYELNFGKIPKNLWVLHKCDNPSCVNPKHLFLGTRSDNMKDCVNKGRMNYNPRRKLNHKEVREIRLLRKEGLSNRKIAKIYDVSHSVINDIIKNKTWKEI